MVTTLTRRILRLAGLAVGLVLIAIAVLHLPPVRGRVLDRVRAYAERENGVALGASSLGYNLLTRTIELRNLSLAATSASQPFLEADRAVISIGPAIFTGRVTVHRISLDRPRLTLVRDVDGTVNLPAPRQSAEQSTPLQLGIVTVTALSMRVDDRVAQRSFAVGPLDLSVDTTASSSRPGAFGPGAFAARVGHTDLSGTIAGRLGFDGTRVRIEDLTVETKEGRVVAGGWADVTGEQPEMSARATATVDLRHAARLAGVDAGGLAGHLDGTIDATGALAAPTLALTVTSRDAAFGSIGRVRLDGRSSFRGTRALIDSLDVNAAAGSVHAEGAIELGEPPPRLAGTTSHVALRWSNLRLDGLAPLLGQSLPVRTGSIAGGTATVDFDPRDLASRVWSRLRATATATLQPVADESNGGSLALSGRMAMQVDQGRWSLNHSIASSRAQTDVSGIIGGRLTDGGALRSTLDGRTNIRARDVGAIPPLIQTAGVTLPPEVVDALAGSMDATIDLDGTLDRPRALVDLVARDVRTPLLPRPANLDARLVADANAVHAQSIRATAGTMSLDGSGRYSWRGPFDARVELRDGDVSETARQFRLPVTIAGSTQLKATISDTRSGVTRAHAEVALSARDIVVEEVVIGAVTATGTLALEDNGLMIVDATAPAIGARAQLEIVNRTGYPVSGEVTLDRDDIGPLVPPRYRQQTGGLTGKVSAKARGSGRLSDPSGIRGRVDLRELDVMALGTRFVLAAPGSITVADDRIAVDAVDVRVGQRTRATLAGQLGVAALPDTLRIHLDGPLSELVDIGARASGTAPVSIRGEGTATLDVAVQGTLGHPLPGGSLVVRSPSLEYGTLPAVTGLALDATIDPTLITLRSLAAHWQGSALSAEGVLPWRVVLHSVKAPAEPASQPPPRFAGWLNALPPEPARARLSMRAENITQAMLKDIVAPEQMEKVQGRASATIAVDADRFALDRLRGTAVFDSAALTLAGVPFTQSVPTRLRFENGRVKIDDFQWAAEGNAIVATGGANITETPPTVDLGVSGVLDLRVLSAFISGIASGGTARANLAVTGPFENPEIIGDVAVAGGELHMDSPRLAASDLEGTVRIAAGRKITLALTGLLNTGTARLEGALDVSQLATPLGKLQFTGRGIALEYPPGLQTESNADIELALGASGSTMSGRVDVLGGRYREALILSSHLLRLSSTNGIVTTTPPADWLSRLRLDVAVATGSDLRIDNNYGRLDVGAALRVVGTAAAPGVLGRMQAGEGGEIYVGGNTYRIERLAIDLTNPSAITPDVNFAAQTRIGDLPIGIELRCPAAGACERNVTSLATNVDDKEAEARLFGTSGSTASAGEGLARLLSGEILGVVGRTVGLDTVRLEQSAARRDIFDDPTLISGDVDPAARLTLAKRLGSNVELVFSQNLADEGFTWITSYTGPHGLSGRLVSFDDQSRSYEFRHEPSFGAGRSRQRPRPPGPRIAAIRITGTPGFPEDELRKHLRLAKGDRFSFSDWQRDQDRLERFYRAQGLAEARIRARRLPAEGNPDKDAVLLEYAIARGPKTRLDIRGATLPDEVRDRIVERWTSALFDGFLERDARTIVREHLYHEGYLQAIVTATVALETSSDLKTLTIDVTPGPVIPGRIDVRGNAALSTEQLLALTAKDDRLAAWLDPLSVARLLEDHYRSEGYLAARVSVGVAEMRNDTSVVTITVIEGAPYSIGEIGLRGLPHEAGLVPRDAFPLSTGDPYRPASVAEGVEGLASRLRQAAYREARIDVETRVDANAGRVDIALDVAPGPRSIVRDVVVQGGDAGKRSVARSIVLPRDAPLDPAAVLETRRRLYELDVYRSVDIDVDPISPTASRPSDTPVAEQPVVATITLEERPRHRFRYGLAVSDEVVNPDEREQHVGFAADYTTRNIFGGGLNAGLSLRLRRDQQVGRATLGKSRLFGLPIRSTLFLEREREQLNPEGALPITSDVTALAAEQAYRVLRAAELRYGYRLERNHTFIRADGPDAFDLTVRIARFTTGGLVDRRDDPFNPARGWFAASTFEVSTPGLGSDLRFMKNFAQYLHFVPLGRGLVVGSAARLGVARTFEGEVLIPSERFFAGGANTVRGYREDDLGARSIFEDAEGGSALLVLNGELRFPVYRRVKGVGFVDLGNVYPTVSDISLTALQVGTGAGARFDTPIGLLRFDFGVPVNRRSFDPRWRIHFGFGHAF